MRGVVARTVTRCPQNTPMILNQTAIVVPLRRLEEDMNQRCDQEGAVSCKKQTLAGSGTVMQDNYPPGRRTRDYTIPQ